MIISKTPFRISLFGGGTDFPKYYRQNSGCVIGGTIDKYCYVTARFLPDVFKHKHRIVWSKNETVQNINEINHPTVKAVFNFMKIKKGLEIHYQGDLQKNSGLGTSSSFCVGLLNSLSNLHNKNITKYKLAKYSINIEQNIMKENCGSQDQIWASYGGFKCIDFLKNGEFTAKNLNLKKKFIDDLNQNLVLIYTGIHKYSNNVEKDKIVNLKNNIKYLDSIYEITKKYKKIINSSQSIENLGDMLNEYWFLKKKLSNKVSNHKIDEIYNTALNSGAAGGKIIGSGGGGFLLVYCKKKYQKLLKSNLKKLVFVKIKFTDEGSKIIFKS